MFGLRSILATLFLALVTFSSINAKFDAPACGVVPHNKASAHKRGPAIPLVAHFNPLTKTTTWQDTNYTFFINQLPDKTVYQVYFDKGVPKKKYVFTIGLKTRSILQIPFDSSKTDICASDILIDPSKVKDVVVHRTD